MNRLVYLFELDSVRNTPEEIRIGQQALFEEIVFNGNKVVLTFNQITDSVAFFSLMQNEERMEQILERFRMGAMQVSSYGVRTVSQYIREALEKNLSDGRNGFIFSGVPIKSSDKKMISRMIEILKDDNIADMERIVEEARSANEPVKEIERLEQLCRYVKLILTLGVENLSGPVQRTGTNINLQNILRYTCDRYTTKSFRYMGGNKDTPERFRDMAIECLRNCAAKNNWSDRRSSWIELLAKMKNRADPNVVRLAVMIVNLCYNYSIEANIPGISHHYIVGNVESFYQDFENRLEQYWGSLQTAGEKKILRKGFDSNIDWALAVRVLKRVQRYIVDMEKEIGSLEKIVDDQLYEKNYEQEKNSGKKGFSVLQNNISDIFLHVS